MSAISVCVLILFLHPVLMCNQLVQSTVEPVCNACLYGLFGQHAQGKKLAIRFIIIKTPHPKKDEFNKFPLFDDDKLIDHIDIDSN